MIQWTTPLMLAGLALLSLPILAHLLNRRSRDRFVVPTIRFLQESVSQQNRFLKLKRWILLLLRAVAVALLVFAFARPIWWQGGGNSNSSESRAVAIVIDASLSTARQQGNSVYFRNLVAAAERSLNQLEPGRDVATVVVARETPQSLVRKLSPNFVGLKDQVAALDWSYSRADLAAAINEAAKQLASHDGSRQLVVISDMQKTNWQQVLNSEAQTISLPPETDIRFVKFNERLAVENIALSEATCSPRDPIAGQSIELSVRINNYTDSVQQVPLVLSAGSSQIDEQVVQIAAGESTFVNFSIEKADPVELSYEFSIPDDALAADNQVQVCTLPGKQTPIAVISDDIPDELGTTSFFIERAIRPFDTDADRFKISTFSSREVGENSLSGQSMVVVGYIGSLGEPAAREITRFVREGGGLVFLCGEGDVASHLQKLSASAGKGFLPFDILGLDRFNDFNRMPYIKSGKWRSRWLKDYDLQSQIALQQIRFRQVWNVSQTDAASDILLTYSDGRPALGVANFEKGKVVLANLSPSVYFSEFGKFGSFAALVQIIIRNLRTDIEELDQHLIGDSIFFDVPVSSSQAESMDSWVVTGPDGKQVETIVSRNDGNQALLVDKTEQPGVYTLEQNQIAVQSIAVAVDNRESDLSVLESELDADQIKAGNFVAVEAGQFSVDLFDKGNPLWGWAALLGLILLTLESCLLGWWKR